MQNVKSDSDSASNSGIPCRVQIEISWKIMKIQIFVNRCIDVSMDATTYGFMKICIFVIFHEFSIWTRQCIPEFDAESESDFTFCIWLLFTLDLSISLPILAVLQFFASIPTQLPILAPRYFFAVNRLTSHFYSMMKLSVLAPGVCNITLIHHRKSTKHQWFRSILKVAIWRQNFSHNGSTAESASHQSVLMWAVGMCTAF